MSKSTAPAVVTAATVRAFLTADEKRLARVPEVARLSVVGSDGKAPRGRLHPLAIKAYNKGRKPERQYVTGNGNVVKAQAKTVRAAHVAAGGGKRGPLPKAQAVTASQPKG